MAEPRKKSPRAPSMSLPDAVERVMAIYENEGKHVIATEVVAQDMGYKDASSGAALSTIASLKYYGLLNVVGRGEVAVSEEVEEYRFTSDEMRRRQLRRLWVTRPAVYKEIIESFSESLPSDMALKYELIKKGFTEKTAVAFLRQFKTSIEFANYYERESSFEGRPSGNANDVPDYGSSLSGQVQDHERVESSKPKGGDGNNIDRIPIRLAGGRRAWLEVPLPFYEGDKEIIKKYIDIIVVDDEE